MRNLFLSLLILISSHLVKSAELPMNNILIVYSSYLGSTKEIVDSMKNYLSNQINNVDILIADEKKHDLTKYDLIIVGSAIHGANPHENIIKFINFNRSQLDQKKIAVFAVCITITSTKEKRRQNALTYPNKIANGIHPFCTTVFAGKASNSGWFGILMGKMILGITPGDYRNWSKIKEWTLSLLEKS